MAKIPLKKQYQARLVLARRRNDFDEVMKFERKLRKL